MSVDRREFLKRGSAAALAGSASLLARAAGPSAPATGVQGAADYTVRIATGLIELSPDRIVSTTLYNGQFPGPLLRFKEGRRVTVDIRNDTDTPELVHWHGQSIPSDVDGLHRHTFELTRIGGKATAGVLKDVVMLGGFQELELDFVADNPGPTLFHCHQQLHMDFGFMALLRYDRTAQAAEREG